MKQGNIDLNQEKEDNTIMNLALIRGGKDTTLPPVGDQEDWLTSLEVGSIFLTYEKPPSMSFHLDQWQLVQKTEKSILLISSLNGMVKLFVPSPARRFCGKYGLHEILGVVREDTEAEETDE